MDYDMTGWLRVPIMVIVSEITLMIIAAGFDINGMLFAGSFIFVFVTLPLVVAVFILHIIQKLTGIFGTIITSMIGLLPTAFVFVAAPGMGIAGGFNHYAQSLCIAGWLWSAAWILTAPGRVQAMPFKSNGFSIGDSSEGK
jgi:hypothetical protein